MFFCSFTCHNKNPFLFPHALLCLWSHPVKPCEWHISFFPQEQWMKKGFLKCTGQRSMEPVEPSVFIYVTVYRWLTVNKLVGWGGVFVSMADGALSLSLSLSLCRSFSLSVSRKCRKHKPHWACCAFGLAMACSEAAVRPESHSLGGLALQMFMI